MFIELTDHLRCPAEHDEAFLVLVPDAVVARGVANGMLGCPVCGAEYPIVAGVAHLGDAPKITTTPAELGADGMLALLGIDGPGGYVVFVGDPGRVVAADTVVFGGIGAVLVNPPIGVSDAPPRVSVLEAGRIPLKSRAVRGVVLGGPYAEDPVWVADARRVLLPGRHLVGQGVVPADASGLQMLASAGGWWVGV